MITLVFSCFLPWANILHPSVLQNVIGPIVPAVREGARERQGTRERGHDACEQNQDLGIASKDKKKARSCRRFCCALLLRRLCSLMQTSSLCNEVVTLAGQKHHNFIVSEDPTNNTVQQDSSDLLSETKRGLWLNIFINSTFHSFKARVCVAEYTKAPLF